MFVLCVMKGVIASYANVITQFLPTISKILSIPDYIIDFKNGTKLY